MKKTPAFFLSIFCLLHIARAQDALVPEDRLLLAEGLLGRGMHALAAEEYAALAALDSVTPDILFRLNECYQRLDKETEAEAAAVRLVEKFPATVETLRVQIQRAQKQPHRAVEFLTPFRNWKGDPALESALLLALADAFQRDAKNAEAVAAYEDLMKRFPNEKTALLAGLNAGLALLADANPENQKRGTQYLFNVANKNPDPQWAAEALYALAQHEYGRKNYMDSAGYFNRLATEHPASPRTHTSRLQAAWASFLSDDRAAALKLLDAHPVADAKSPDHQSWLYLRATLLRLDSDPAARAAYENFLTLFPNPEPRFADVNFSYSALLFEQKDFTVLHQFMQQNHDFQGRAEEAAWFRAQAAEEVKNHDQALALYHTFERDFAQSALVPTAIYRVAHIQGLQNKHADSAQTFTRLAENFNANPAAQNAWFLAGIAWKNANDKSKAITALQHVLEQKPDSPYAEAAAINILTLAFDEQRLDLAEAAATALIDRFPESEYRAKSFFIRADLRRKANDAKRAEEDFRACLALDTQDVLLRDNARMMLGMMCHGQARFHEAAALFQTLLEADPIPLPASTLHWLTQFQLDDNQPARAEAAGLALIQIRFAPALEQETHFIVARALHAQNKNPEAIAHLKTGLAFEANTTAAASAALLLGQLQLLAQDCPAANTAFQDAVKRASTPALLSIRADAYLGLAQTADTAGKPDEALRYNLAVSLLFDDPARVPLALDRAIALLEKLNRHDEAKLQLQELLTRYPDSPQARQRPPLQ